ncbi:LOW QUALITY PROTEIN: 26S proteasome non-ATPase regulatory subunit 12-like [Penaeus chinensis]|uniref:LOW QUALITY PROTEIN: 26S proteasome non-ATPase regulatory subunit 12-like n=1 Tax=Penaeus chinensis TaxID=139456 RepID=UPI001FB6617B|nr:LOW QUALITY PROTEIN: 26S proteasome non-ATPase regulatory subunit 12-like [Penaeus chinensis]
MSSAEKNTSEKKSSEKKTTEKKTTEKKTEDSALPSVIMDGGRVVKMEVDYSTTCDEKIPAAQQLAKEGRVQEAVESLMVLEKQTRTGADAHSTSRVLVAIVEICFGAGEWNLMNESIVTLTKKRSQIKMAVTKMVQKCCEYVDQTPDKETKLKLMDTLRTVTAGKIYVEVERARLTHKLAMMKEPEGDITEAATILQELQVETFGSMERKEKVEMILEQMRLCLLKKDFVRTQIISKKISTKFFDNEKVDDLKLKFYNLMIELDSHESSFLSICRHYRAIYDSKSVQEDEAEKKRILKHVILFIILAPYDNEQNDLLHRIKEDKTLEEIPQYKDLLQLFVTAELIKWSGLCDVYESELRSNANTVFPKNEDGDNRWTQLKNRVVEHNIRMMAKYYTRIYLKRMAELLDLSVKESEEFLCQLVVSGTVTARMDRLEGIVNFGTTPEHSQLLNSWADSLHHLMALVNKTTHLINKEEMVHKHLLTLKE